MVLLEAKACEARRNDLTKSHFQSKLLRRAKLHYDNDIFIVISSSLTEPYFVVYTKYHCTMRDNRVLIDNRTAYIGQPQHE